MKKEKKIGLLIWDIPKELRQRFKASAAARGESMKVAIMRFMEEYIRKEPKPLPKTKKWKMLPTHKGSLRRFMEDYINK